MSAPPADPSRMATRAKNIDQHPGDVVKKRTRRNKVQMAEFREQQRLQQEEKEMAVKAQLQAAAQLEDIIAAKDKTAAAGVATKKRKAMVSTKVAKNGSSQVPVRKVVQNVSGNNITGEYRVLTFFPSIRLSMLTPSLKRGTTWRF